MRGGKSVRSVTLRLRRGAGVDVQVPCDFVALSTGADAQRALLQQAGVDLPHAASNGGAASVATQKNVYAAGSVAGAADSAASLEHGRQIGAEVGAVAAGGGTKTSSAPPAGAEARGSNGAHSYDTASTGKSFVCPCEDVTVGDIRLAIAEGFQDVQSLKRYSTVTMGPCQGKMCVRGVV